LDVWVPPGWTCLDDDPPPKTTTTAAAAAPSAARRRPLALLAGRDGAAAEVWDLTSDAAAPLLRLVPPGPPGRTEASGGPAGRGLVMAARWVVGGDDGGGAGSRGGSPPRALTAQEDGTLSLWALPPTGGAGPVPATLSSPLATLTAHGDAPMALALARCSDGGGGGGPCRGWLGVSGAADDLLCVFSVGAAVAGSGATAPLARCGAVRLPAPGVGAVSIRPAHTPIAAALGWDGRTRLALLPAEEEGEGSGGAGFAGRPPVVPLAELAYHAAPGSAAAFEPGASGRLLATGGRDGAIALWDVTAVVEAAGG
jgi:hypothetical protein